MEISKTYDPKKAENQWYTYWMRNGFFRSLPDNREPYTIVMPPPNVTGVLHMGHMLNNTIQDVLIRRARMQGKNACWVPGTDHASIATEAKVVSLLKQQGISKKELSREEFLSHAWNWKEKYGDIILEQLKKLGASCDWVRTRFTMEQDLSEAVLKVFVDLYNKGLIYRGVRMVNWDPVGLTAVSDEEVIHKEVNSKLFYIKYKIDGEDEFITIATTRPETILGDTAVCVNPNDERYKHLKGKYAIIPMVDRKVPIIFDEYVTMEFGTGALKVTPAHDINDYNLGIKHKLEVIDTINPNGTMSEEARFYVGEDRFTVRKMIVRDLENIGRIAKTEEIKNKVGFSERTDAVIEPKLSMQWFLKMEAISKPALDAVLNDEVKLYPDKFKNTYKAWMENVHDWCISRQLWWGQRIPAYYLKNGEVVVAETPEQALSIARQKTGTDITMDDLRQDEDVVDTWFSSWLWPISVFDGFKNPNNEDIKYYYPTNDLVTAPEILFFWVARMIIAGYEYKKTKPFTNVYLTGIVRDKQGRKMSKSLGNSPDPLDLIEKHGADGVRTGMLFSSPAGNDLPFDESLCEQGRNFANKIWNAFRLVQGFTINDNRQSDINRAAVEWFSNHFNEQLAVIEDHFSKYRISDALVTLYKLIWDDYCSWYLEMIKPAFGESIDRATHTQTLTLFENLLKTLHPFMPFISEELWHLVKKRNDKDCIIVASYPVVQPFDVNLLEEFKLTREVITQIRNVRKEKNLSPKEQLVLIVRKNGKVFPARYMGIIEKLGNTSSIAFATEKPDNSVSFIVKGDEYFIPLLNIDSEDEKQKLEKELDYTLGFRRSVEAKLNNERFVSSAKQEVVENERRKLSDANTRIQIIQERLKELSESSSKRPFDKASVNTQKKSNEKEKNKKTFSASKLEKVKEILAPEKPGKPIDDTGRKRKITEVKKVVSAKTSPKASDKNKTVKREKAGATGIKRITKKATIAKKSVATPAKSKVTKAKKSISKKVVPLKKTAKKPVTTRKGIKSSNKKVALKTKRVVAKKVSTTGKLTKKPLTVRKTAKTSGRKIAVSGKKAAQKPAKKVVARGKKITTKKATAVRKPVTARKAAKAPNKKVVLKGRKPIIKKANSAKKATQKPGAARKPTKVSNKKAVLKSKKSLTKKLSSAKKVTKKPLTARKVTKASGKKIVRGKKTEVKASSKKVILRGRKSLTKKQNAAKKVTKKSAATKKTVKGSGKKIVTRGKKSATKKLVSAKKIIKKPVTARKSNKSPIRKTTKALQNSGKKKTASVKKRK